MIQQKLSLFQCLTSVPSKAVGLEEVVRLIRYDNGVTAKTENYRRMASVLGKEKADEEVKKKLVPAFSVGVLFDGNGRGAANVLGFTGLALCDIDHVSGEGQEVRGERNDQALNESFEKATADPHALMVYRTISGDGLRIIYRYVRDEGPLTATSWRAAFLKGNTYFAELTGHDYDTQCTDYSRLSGMAHDDEVYVNWEAEAFVITDEEILEANFDGRGEKGKPRKEYAAGSHAVTVEEAWPRVEQTLARRQMVYQSGHHHDYVMHAAFLFNRYGADQDELLTWAARGAAERGLPHRERRGATDTLAAAQALGGREGDADELGHDLPVPERRRGGARSLHAQGGHHHDQPRLQEGTHHAGQLLRGVSDTARPDTGDAGHDRHAGGRTKRAAGGRTAVLTTGRRADEPMAYEGYEGGFCNFPL